MLRLFAKYLIGKVLFVRWFFVALSPLLLIVWLRHGEPLVSSWLGAVAALWLVASLFGSLWLASTTSRYMVDENQMFLDAVKRTWYDARLRFAFLPIIGYFFTPDEDKTHYDED